MFQFQGLEVYERDIRVNRQYIYHCFLFGKTKDNQDVCCIINDFQPYICILKSEFPSFLLSEEYTELYTMENCNGKRVYGFTNQEIFDFYKLKFKNMSNRKKIVKLLEERQINCYDSNIDCFTQLLSSIQASPNSSFEITFYDLPENDYFTCCDHEYIVSIENISVMNENINPNWVILSFDIECESYDYKFPQPKKDLEFLYKILNHCNENEKIKILEHVFEYEIHIDLQKKYDLPRYQCNPKPNIYLDDFNIYNFRCNIPGDSVRQIGMCFEWGTNKYNCILVYSDEKLDYVNNGDVFHFNNEKDMLCYFVKLIREYKTDLITGYNINGFDWSYLYERSKVLGIEHEFDYLSKVSVMNDKLKSKYQEITMSSNQMGRLDSKYFDIPGRINFDLYKYLTNEQNGYKLEVYKLDFVAETYLGEKKHDIHFRDIFEKINGQKEDIQIIAEYCIQDCELVLKLINKLQIFINCLGMTNATYCPPRFIFNRGQGIRLFTGFYHECKLNGYIPDGLRFDQKYTGNDYQGAIVLEPVLGYHQVPVTVPDYASLYPNCMISHNLSPDAFVIYPEYDNLKDVKYIDLCPRDNVSFRFAQEFQGIGVKYLQKLVKKRKEVKKKMEQTEDKFLKSIYNGLQLAYKVVCNSWYGQMANTTFQFCCSPIAECTTYIGRTFLEMARDSVYQVFQGQDTIYNKQLSGECPILCKNQEQELFICTLDELYEFSQEIYEEYRGQNKNSIDTKNEISIWINKWLSINYIHKYKEQKHTQYIYHTGHLGYTITTEPIDNFTETLNFVISKCGKEIIDDKDIEQDVLDFLKEIE